MKYLLDTNILIEHQRGRFNLAQYLVSQGIDISECAVSEITWIEFMFGEKLARHKGVKNLVDAKSILSNFTVLPISKCKELFVSEKARLQFEGTPQANSFDLLIGCTGVVYDLIVVTDNIKDFKNISGIRIENWIHRQ